jgi:hypothetical protein
MKITELTSYEQLCNLAIAPLCYLILTIACAIPFRISGVRWGPSFVLAACVLPSLAFAWVIITLLLAL